MLKFKEKIILISRYYYYLETTEKEDNPLSFIDFIENLSTGALIDIYDESQKRCN